MQETCRRRLSPNETGAIRFDACRVHFVIEEAELLVDYEHLGDFGTAVKWEYLSKIIRIGGGT
jgi:hypothetical protein